MADVYAIRKTQYVSRFGFRFDLLVWTTGIGQAIMSGSPITVQSKMSEGVYMDTVQVRLSGKEWQELVRLGQEGNVSPDRLLNLAVRRFVDEKKRLRRARRALQESFGVWKDRDDLEADSTVIVGELRREWDERERRLGLA